MAAGSRTPTRACGMPSAGSDLQGAPVPTQLAFTLEWSWWTKRSSAVSRVRSRVIGPATRWLWAISP